ncbi:MAG: hypothetical protein KC431_20340, partial [Myxococcales bacterium]|nr:hypothetical protein [Myxococcales bacterium]
MSEVSVLLISEDGSKWAFETLEALCWSMFNWLTPNLARGSWLRFAPVNDAARVAATANMWKSKRPRDSHKILTLCQTIATQLLREDGFVFFHVDGDVIWGERPSDNLTRFDAIIRTKVRDIIRGHLKKGSAEHSDARLDAIISKFNLLAPCYSIETWLFANLRVLRQLGVSNPIVDVWERDLSELDRTAMPKSTLSLTTRDYPTLARELPVSSLYRLQTSFAASIHEAGACGSLITRLRLHWPDWVRVQYGLRGTTQ